MQRSILCSLALLTVFGCEADEDDTDTQGDGGHVTIDGGTATDSGGDGGTGTEPATVWWFQVTGTQQVHIAATCAFADPFTESGWDSSWTAVVGWFDGTATFGTATLGAGAATGTVLTADGLDGFLAVLDPEGELVRVVVFGGPGDQRGEACSGADGLVGVGTFAGTMSFTEVEDTLTAVSSRDVFQYSERVKGTVWVRSVEHVVAGPVESVFLGAHSFLPPRVVGTFEGEITVFPDTPEAWSATSAGGLDAFYARPSWPLLLSGPGQGTLRYALTWVPIGGWGGAGARLLGSASEGATLVSGDTVTPVPAGSGGADAMLAWSGDWLDETSGEFSVLAFGGAGDDEARVLETDNPGGAEDGTYLTATFDGGEPGAITRWGESDLVAMGGTDVLLYRLENSEEWEKALVVGSPGEDSLKHASVRREYGAGGHNWIRGGLVSGQFTDGPFQAPGLAPLESCGAPTTWVLTFDYDGGNGYQPTWLGGGCGLTVEEVGLDEDGGTFVVADHGAGAWLDLPTRSLVPPDPPEGGTGAFVASWGP